MYLISRTWVQPTGSTILDPTSMSTSAINLTYILTHTLPTSSRHPQPRNASILKSVQIPPQPCAQWRIVAVLISKPPITSTALSLIATQGCVYGQKTVNCHARCRSQSTLCNVIRSSEFEYFANLGVVDRVCLGAMMRGGKDS